MDENLRSAREEIGMYKLLAKAIMKANDDEIRTTKMVGMVKCIITFVLGAAGGYVIANRNKQNKKDTFEEFTEN